MNIALGAVIIFILLLPPITFYFAYCLGRFTKAGPTVSILEGLMLSAIFAVLVHATAIFFIYEEIRFDVLAYLLGGDLKGFHRYISNDTINHLFRQFAIYNSCILLIMFSIARLIRFLVLRMNLHSRIEFFRVYNYWWYLFHGYKTDKSIDSNEPIKFDIVWVDALVNTSEGMMIYSGYLLDYVCSGETLDRIYLSEASKRDLRSNRLTARGNYKINVPGDSKEIDGDTLIIEFSNIINLNLHFINFPDELVSYQEAAK